MRTNAMIFLIGVFIVLQLCSGCRVERREETTVTYQQDLTLSQILEETCGNVEPQARKGMCVETVAAWYEANSEPYLVHGVY